MNLLIDATCRKESRTLELAEFLIEVKGAKYEKAKLYDMEFRTTDENLLNLRDKATRNNDFSDTYFDNAKTFREAEEIIIAAPFWDFSFPAILKQYIESICINGLTFYYNDKGIPCSLCKCKKVYFVTTAGGPIYDNSYSFGYIKGLFEGLFGVKNYEYINAENLDIIGNDANEIIKSTKEKILNENK